MSSQVAPWAARGRDTITRACGDQEADLDWGVATLATLAYALREYAEEGNDRPLAAAQEALRVESRVLSKALRGRGSKRAAKAKTALARRHRRVANCHKERNHQLTARIVRGHKLIVTEELAPSNMRASAKGTAEKPSRNGESGTHPRDPRRHAGIVPEHAWHQSGRSWVRTDRLEHPQGEAVPDAPLLRDCSEESLGRAYASVRAVGSRQRGDQAAALAMLVAGLRLARREPIWARAREPRA
ncbi:MAG TPA: transposase [Hyphomicrobiaceae bacterium]|nr:transposase [Hyphomicrobiaceae bacterium]